MQPKETLIKLDAYITEARTPLRALRKLSSIVLNGCVFVTATSSTARVSPLR